MNRNKDIEFPQCQYLPFRIVSSMNGNNVEILEKTAGNPGSAQPYPQLVTPVRCHLPSLPSQANGPPLSPYTFVIK